MRALAMVAAAVVMAAGCRDRDDLDGRRRQLPGLGSVASERERNLSGDVAVDLFDNRPGAVAIAEGSLVVEATRLGLIPHVDSGTLSSWHVKRNEGRNVALVDGFGGELIVPIDGDRGGVERRADGSLRIAFRARAAAVDQLVSVFLNERRLGDVAMPSTRWATYDVLAPADAIKLGENRLRFYFREVGEIDGVRTAAAFERLVVGGEHDPAVAALHSGIVEHDDEKAAALTLARGGRISYYLVLPAGQPRLVVSLAGAGSAEVRLAAAGAGGLVQAWSGSASASWRDVSVDLGDHAGRAVRLDFLADAEASWGRPQIVTPSEPESAAELEPVDHIVVWGVASLRADRVLGERAPTPFARFAASGLTLAAAHATSPLPAVSHGAMASGRRDVAAELVPGIETTAERLRQAGFATALISGNGFVTEDAGLAQGFDRYENPMRKRRHHGARALWRRAVGFLGKRTSERTFVVVATSEPHLPYACAERPSLSRGPLSPTKTAELSAAVSAGKRTLSAAERQAVAALYDGCVADNAAAFAEMLESLDELGVRSRSAVVLVGDHGEELWERGAFGRSERLFQENLWVPLVIGAPGVRARRIEEPASLVDLHPTLLELAGVVPEPVLHGRSLLGPRAAPGMPRPVFSRIPGRARSLRLGRYKLIAEPHDRARLYDLDADPGERRDIADRNPTALRALRTILVIGTAFETAWSTDRWGTANQLRPTFVADHGR